jgi:hypothetical protein
MLVGSQLLASVPELPSFWQVKWACWSKMQPPFTQIWPLAHAGPPASGAAHGATQRDSTQTAPPWQSALEAQMKGFTLQTPRSKSHW